MGGVGGGAIGGQSRDSRHVALQFFCVFFCTFINCFFLPGFVLRAMEIMCE